MMLHPTERTVLPDDVEVTPFLLRHKYGGSAADIQVEVSNPTMMAVTISPRALLCELQQVEIVQESTQENQINREHISADPKQGQNRNFWISLI